MTIRQFIERHTISTVENADILVPPYPFRHLTDWGTVPCIGQSVDGQISVALFLESGLFAVVKTEPPQRFEGNVWEDYVALDAL